MVLVDGSDDVGISDGAWLLVMKLMMLRSRNEITGGNGDACSYYIELIIIVQLKTKHSKFDRESITLTCMTHIIAVSVSN